MPRKKSKSRANPPRSRGRPGRNDDSGPPPTGDPVEETSAALADNLPPVAVVGVGASAGGLEAFSQLIRALPRECTLPMVFVQHLSPDRESMISTLLKGTSHLNAVQAEDGTSIEPSTIYVIPPNCTIQIEAGKLRLQPRPADRASFNPIDVFFGSLARYARQRAIGIVLSGSASDGSAGLREIKYMGGITIAQKPETAKQDGMPRSAIATGAVDMVLSPVEIAVELGVLCRHPYLDIDATRTEGEPSSITDDELIPILAVLKKVTGTDFNHYKTPTIKRRLQRRMAVHRLARVPPYLALLKERPEEVRQLYQDILIHVTRFFREPESFDILRRVVFPEIMKTRREDEGFRIWIPGCSTGEEAYSVAIELLEYLGDEVRGVPIQIFATDVSENAVEKARAGVFSAAIAQDVSRERLRRFFTHQDDHYRIHKSTRDFCIFARQDLTRDPPFSRMDLIVCRNVLIYMGHLLQRRILSIFHYALKPQRFLMLGSAETVGLHGDMFSVADKHHRLYTKKAVGASTWLTLPSDYGSRSERQRRGERETRTELGIHNELNRFLLDRYAPASILVNSDFEILQTRGRAATYLEVAPGEPTFNVLKMVREGLLHPVREALQKAATANEVVRKERVQVRIDGGYREVNLEVIPFSGLGVPALHFLLVFDELRELRGAVKKLKEKTKKSPAPSARRHPRVKQLELELAASRQYLQSTIQDREAANEELQSANEEILSANEELQSTNEELDTAKEELQSTNEELNTINEELNARNEELTRVNSDLVNFLAAAEVAIVIISHDLKVRRFTPMAEKVLNLIPSDVGRPIQQVKPSFDLPELEHLILETIDSLATKERVVTDGNGRRHLLKIQPYKDIDNRIDGAVLVVFDIDSTRRSDAVDTNVAEVLVQNLPGAQAVLDSKLRVKVGNRMFWSLAGAGSKDGNGRSLREIFDPQWNPSGLVSALESLPRGDYSPQKATLMEELAPGKTRIHRVEAQRLAGQQEDLILLTIESPDSGSRRSEG